MNYAGLITANCALVCLLGCTTPTPFSVQNTVGPAPAERQGSLDDSSLQVYSARVRAPVDVNKEEFLWNNDFGRNDFLYEPAHTDYAVYSQNGHIFKQVRNASGPDDPQPAALFLPPGRYEVQAYARDVGLINIPVVIEPGRRTRVNLQRIPSRDFASVPKAEAVCLAGDRVVGWRADSTSQ
jgi:hypothetical protein